MTRLLWNSLLVAPLCLSVSNTAIAASSLATNGTLTSGQQLSNGSYRLIMQGDGNLVLRNASDAALWAAGTNGMGGTRLVLQADDNLVIYTSAGKAIWASNTVGTGANLLQLGTNGSLALYKNSTVVKTLYGAPAITYALAVNNGSGSGSNYTAGQTVPITANAAPSGQAFNTWVVNYGNPVIANVNAASTTLTMPASNVTVTAKYATASGSVVLPSDTVLVPPSTNGPILGTITGYVWDNGKYEAQQHEMPIYSNLDRDSDDFWNYLVDELLLSRVNVVMLHGRGCTNVSSGTAGAGDMCPRVLSKFVAAVKRAGAENVIKVGMWDDTGMYPGNAGVDRLDLSNKNNWSYFWDHNMKIWFDTLPSSMWYRMDGKPVVAFWSLSDAFFSNQQGHASALLTWLKTQFKTRYNVEPSFILQDNWFANDTTVNTNHAVGKHGWFHPQSDVANSIYSYLSYNGTAWGAVAPSYRNNGSYAGCGSSCREVTRRNGATLDAALTAGKNAHAKFTLLEGWTNIVESAGFYRSDVWSYPCQYINIVRRYADPTPATLRFQAEGADRFNNPSNTNQGGEYSNRKLDVGKLADGSGWYVGWIKAGEWLEYQNVELGSGTYRFTVRVATNATGKKMHLEVGGVALPSIEVPNTGGLASYQLVHLGERALSAGTYNLKLVFESNDGMNVDWFFLKRK